MVGGHNCFNIREENQIHESYLLGFPENSHDSIVITYCIRSNVGNTQVLNASFGKSFLKQHFKCCRDTKIQSFQFRIIHRIIPCNQWLKN